jgi:lipoyl(octanoyl) transferase
MRTIWLGEVPYPAAMNLQAELAGARRMGLTDDIVLLLTHPPTITLGRGAHAEHLLADPARLAALDISVHTTNRGGDITYHGPNQLIGYPILDLSARRPDIHWYLRTLEQALIDALEHWDISARRFPPYTGVWVRSAKIAAIGISVRRWITAHGFALNVTEDLGGFDLIVPCGIRDYGVTSISRQVGRSATLTDALHPVAEALARHFPPTNSVSSSSFSLSPASAEILRQGLDLATGGVLDC